MRRVIVHWNRAAIINRTWRRCWTSVEAWRSCLNLAVHPDGVTHLMRIEFEEGYGPEALDEIGFLNVIRVDDLGGGIHHIEVVDKHTVALAIAEMDGVAVITTTQIRPVRVHHQSPRIPRRAQGLHRSDSPHPPS